MDAIGVTRAHLSGESLGGWVVSRVAADHPAKVNRLVLNTAGGSQADLEVMKRIITLSMAAAENPTWETVQARIKWLMADKSKGYDDLVASRQRVYRQPGFVSAMRDIMALQDPEIRARNLLGADDYGSITAPTLVLWTSDDPTADVTEGRRIASMIPGARFEVMSGCGHWPQYEDTKTFDRLHLDFLLGR
jgi:2-hydroxy-6-oxonona-2,4-dienedioate hydrolase